uniref:Uncharacterized protein n=1 Tax=Plectus sambesii TaxID=2011161 RepID=A0A914XK76_9BILA
MPDSDMISYNLKGVVFDSAPAPVSAFQKAQAMTYERCPPSSFDQDSWTVFFILLCHFIFCLLQSLYLYLLGLHDPSTLSKTIPYYELGSLVHLPVRQLYLFSQSDMVCPYKAIEAFMNRQQRERFADTDQLCWDVSPHCDHMRYHPEEYRRKIKSFLKYSLRQVIDSREGSTSVSDVDFDRRRRSLSSGTWLDD